MPGFPDARADDLPAASLRPALLGDTSDLYLAVFINGSSCDLIAAFRRRSDGRLAIAPDELRQAGLLAVSEAIGDDGLVDINRLPGVTATYDERGQAIRFTASEAARAPRILDASPRLADETKQSDQSVGAVIDYTLYASAGRASSWRIDGASGLVDARVFGPFGTISGSVLATSSPDLGARVRRLDTAWTYSDPTGPTVYQAGDLISGGLDWTRSVRLGGLQVRRNFALRPDLVTLPLASLRGSADVPSTVDIYVDGARRFSADVPVGPFQIDNIPLVTGAGTTRLVVRDALGRESASEQPFYSSSGLLAAGLWDYSAELGVPRRDYGGISDAYVGRLMGSLSLRYGLSNALTLEAHGEGGGGLINGGAGVVSALGPYGVGSLSLAASRTGRRSGAQISAGIEAEWHTIHIYAHAQRTSGDYNDIASVTAAPSEAGLPATARPPRALDQLVLSVPIGSAASSINLSYTRLVDEGQDARIFGLAYSRPFGDASVFATLYRDMTNGGANGVFVGLSVPLGADINATASVARTRDNAMYAMEIAKSESLTPGSYGWRVQAAAGRDADQAAALSYRADFARLEGDISHSDGSTTVSAQVDGAITLAGGGVFFSNRIDDAFAVVDAGAPGVAVALENRPVGETDAKGLLLVPGLRAYEPNHLSIDPTGLPLSAAFAETSAITAPADRAGSLVHFDIATGAQAALVTLRVKGGGFVPAGSTGRLDGAQADFIVGYDGAAYVVGLEAQNRATIVQADGDRCVAEFPFAATSSAPVQLPDVACRPETP